MILLLLLLNGEILCDVSPHAIDEGALGFLRGVFNAVFPPEKSHLIYVTDGGRFSHLMEAVLVGERRIFAVFGLDHIIEGNGRWLDFKCDGYVISADNSSGSLDALFDGHIYFQAHKTVLVFHEGLGPFEGPPFNWWFSKRDLRMFAVEVRATTVGLDFLVTNAPSGRSLGKWSKGVSVELDPKNISGAAWEHLLDNHVDYGFCPPFFQYESDENGSLIIGTARGLSQHLLEEAAKSWPLKFHEYSWNSKTLCDFTVCYLWMGMVDVSTYDITVPIFPTYFTALVPKPKLLPDATFMLQPFQLLLWIIVATFAAFVGVALLLIAKFHENHTDHKSIYLDRSLGLTHSLRFLTSGSVASLPSKTSSLMVIFPWSITCLMLATAYSAGFTSSLSAPRFTKPINTLEELVESGVSLVVDEDTFEDLVDNLRSISPDVEDNMIVEKDPAKLAALAKTHEAAIVASLDFSFPSSYFWINFHVDFKDLYHLKYLGEYIRMDYSVLYVPKGSAFKAVFDGAIFRFQQHGLLQVWYDELYPNKKHAATKRSFMSSYSGNRRVGRLAIAKTQSAFYLLVFGITLGVLVFFAELLWSSLAEIFDRR